MHPHRLVEIKQTKINQKTLVILWIMSNIQNRLSKEVHVGRERILQSAF